MLLQSEKKKKSYAIKYYQKGYTNERAHGPYRIHQSLGTWTKDKGAEKENIEIKKEAIRATVSLYVAWSNLCIPVFSM